jgi:histidine ammonia-lyase
LLQSNLVLSHAVGVGTPLPAAVVRLTLALKIATLARGFSGVRRVLVDALVKLYNADVLPRIPSKGSVGASGDLAPLAHLSAVLLGVGEVECGGKIMSADEGLKKAGLTRIKLAAKEGLALLNGTQISTALALVNLFSIDNLYSTALVAGALSVERGGVAVLRCTNPRAARPSGADRRGRAYRDLLAQPHQFQSSRLRRVQDPFWLRCSRK